MSGILELAVPLASNSLTFFIGSGFSKYLTNGKAPNWLELMVELVSEIDDSCQSLRSKYFNINSKNDVDSCKYDLIVCAQMLEIEYLRKGKDIRESIVDILKRCINDKTIDKIKVRDLSSFFQKHKDKDIGIVTTNYDTLLNEYVLANFGRAIVEGSPIPKSKMNINIYHIHGCMSNPKSIVFTMSDYFKFQQKDTYFARKFFTILQENTIAVIGYSLGDFNLNCILNEAENSNDISLNKSNIYLIAKDTIDDVIKNYFSYTYGIKVLDNQNVDEFFSALDSSMCEAQQIVKSVNDLPDVIAKKSYYVDDYLKVNDSLRRIILQAYIIGKDLKDTDLQKVFEYILTRKQNFTTESGAWDQYVQFAEWLVLIGNVIELKGTYLENIYLSFVDNSFSMMSKNLKTGYSWGAFKVWKQNFNKMKLGNQKIIKEYYDKKSTLIAQDIQEVLSNV